MNLIKKILIGVIPFAVGTIAALFNKFDLYKNINMPKIAPPSYLFPIVWTILYIFMGIVLVRLVETNKKENIFIFSIQLFLNFIWTFLFFKFKAFLSSFIIIIFLDVFVFYLILRLFNDDRKSAYYLMPYLLWICFASYLNWMVYLLN